jgi:hypothetical protein
MFLRTPLLPTVVVMVRSPMLSFIPSAAVIPILPRIPLVSPESAFPSATNVYTVSVPEVFASMDLMIARALMLLSVRFAPSIDWAAASSSETAYLYCVVVPSASDFDVHPAVLHPHACGSGVRAVAGRLHD